MGFIVLKAAIEGGPPVSDPKKHRFMSLLHHLPFANAEAP